MAKDKDGNTPLHFASMMGNDSVVHKLLSKGANVNAMDNQGVTPIFLANYCGHGKVVNILRNAGAY
jgi:ankyrin repeat protein